MNLTISTGTNLISQDLVLSKAAAIADTQTALDSLVIDLQVALELQPGWLWKRVVLIGQVPWVFWDVPE